MLVDCAGEIAVKMAKEVVILGCDFNFIYLVLAALSLHYCGATLAVVRGLLTVVASLLAEIRLWSTGSVVVAHRLSCSMAFKP